MKAYCLASSSEGNAFVFQFDIEGRLHNILVECGLPYSTILHKLNEVQIKLSDIEACLITHHHSDHSKSASKLIERGIPVFASKGTLETLKLKGNVIYPKEKFRVLNGLFGMCFPVEHDAVDSMGFIIKTATECVIFINDNKKWNTNLFAIKPDYVFIECNYDHHVVYPQITALEKEKEELIPVPANEELIKEVNTKLKQLDRNVHNHMSLRGCIKGLHKLNLSRCKAIVLMHLSDRYANEYRMKNEIKAEFGIRTYVAGRRGGIK